MADDENKKEEEQAAPAEGEKAEAKAEESKAEENKADDAKSDDKKAEPGTDYVEVASKYGKLAMKVAGKFAGDMFKSAKQSVSEISEDLKKEEEKKKAEGNADDKKD